MECVFFNFILRGTPEEIDAAIVVMDGRADVERRYATQEPGKEEVVFVGNMPPFVPR